LQISHLKVVGPSNWGTLRRGIERIEELQSRGFEVAFDQYPWTATSTGLKICVPGWAYEGGEQAFQRRLREPAQYRKILEETNREIAVRGGGGENIMIASVGTAECAWMAGKRLDEIAGRLRLTPGDAALHILRQDGPAVVAIYFCLCEEDVVCAMQSPCQCLCTDGILGAHPHPRAYSSFPRFLGRYVRDKKLMTLEAAIRKITMEPARRLRLWDRGIIREGMDADLVLFDPDSIADVNCYERPSLPPAGIERVWVRGELKSIGAPGGSSV
jgi:N-acyl-D-amino-acid deacylase